jgi:hypothetical protein
MRSLVAVVDEIAQMLHNSRVQRTPIASRFGAR